MGRTKTLALARQARDIMAEKKAIDARLFDVREISGVTDYYLVASGNSPAHLKALLNEVLVKLKDDGTRCFRRSGDPESGWLVIDYVDVIIHLFTPETREYYAVETLWAQAPEIP